MKIKKIRKITLKILVLFLGMYLLINIISVVTDRAVTISVIERGFLEDSISLNGFIFREKALISSTVGGVLEAVVPAGETRGV